MMVDLQLTNKKLVERSKRIVMIAAGVDYLTAERYLQEAGGHVKTALVMIKTRVSAEEARKRIEASDGFVRGAVAGAL
jgi:N-acetylmuramic acid 6-phosphate etherase